MRGPDGAVRPHWQVLDRALNAFGPGEMWRRWEQARQLIRQHGVSFNVYGDARGLDRPWPLDPVPVVLAPDEFATLAAGLAQRATLFDRLLADIYGPRRVIAEGLLPPEVVLGHPGLLRACAGITPPGGRFLHFYAADLVRTPEGDLRVLADRTQAPAGAGYALENRIVLGRVLPEAFRECHAQRLASFFRTLRDTLAALAPHGRENPRIVLLTAGPHNATYFEQAFLAQYLGLPAGRGGRSDRARRAGVPEDAGRAAPGRRHPAPAQRRLVRSAGAAAGVAAGRARACCRRRATARSRSRTRWARGWLRRRRSPRSCRRSAGRCWARSCGSARSRPGGVGSRRSCRTCSPTWARWW